MGHKKHYLSRLHMISCWVYGTSPAKSTSNGFWSLLRLKSSPRTFPGEEEPWNILKDQIFHGTYLLSLSMVDQPYLKHSGHLEVAGQIWNPILGVPIQDLIAPAGEVLRETAGHVHRI